jgi:hypothetical protein
MKKRGRPPTKATLERRRSLDKLLNPPPHIKKLSPEEVEIALQPFIRTDAIQNDLLAAYKHGPWTPDEHAFRMAAVGDTPPDPYDERVLKDEEMYSQRAKEIRKRAGETNREKARPRLTLILDKNKILIGLITTSQTYKIHKVAKIIFEQWGKMSSAQMLHGEDDTMTCRGDGGKRPSIRTIERWIEQLNSTFDKPRN